MLVMGEWWVLVVEFKGGIVDGRGGNVKGVNEAATEEMS